MHSLSEKTAAEQNGCSRKIIAAIASIAMLAGCSSSEASAVSASAVSASAAESTAAVSASAAEGTAASGTAAATETDEPSDASELFADESFNIIGDVNGIAKAMMNYDSSCTQDVSIGDSKDLSTNSGCGVSEVNDSRLFEYDYMVIPEQNAVQLGHQSEEEQSDSGAPLMDYYETAQYKDDGSGSLFLMDSSDASAAPKGFGISQNDGSDPDHSYRVYVLAGDKGLDISLDKDYRISAIKALQYSGSEGKYLDAEDQSADSVMEAYHASASSALVLIDKVLSMNDAIHVSTVDYVDIEELKRMFSLDL